MNPDIERLCRAAAEHSDSCTPWNQLRPQAQENWRRAMEAALTELRKPSEGMVSMGSNELCRRFTECNCPGDENGATDPKCFPASAACWQAMIDHLLRDSDEQD